MSELLIHQEIRETELRIHQVQDPVMIAALRDRLKKLKKKLPCQGKAGSGS